MALRVSASLAKRLEAVDRIARRSDLEQRYQLATVLGRQVLTAEDVRDLTPWQWTVLTWPRVLPVDEWQALAADAQEKLVTDTNEWLGPPVVDSSRNLDDVTHRYKPDPARVQR